MPPGPPATQSAFVPDRSRAVVQAALATAWDAVAGSPRFGGTRRLVVIKSRPGMGTTRMLRQLYEVCAASQSGYWPPSLADLPGVPQDVIYPGNPAGPSVLAIPHTEPGEAIPYFWWGLVGADDRRTADGAADQLALHLKPIQAQLEFAQRKLSPAVGETFWEPGAVVAGLLALAPDLPEEVIAGCATAAVADAIYLGLKATKDFNRRQRERAEIARSMGVDPDRACPESLDNTRQLLTGVAQLVPLVVAVDHAERLDRPTAELLAGLLGSDASTAARVLVALAIDETSELFSRQAKIGLAPLIGWAQQRGLPSDWWGPGGPSPAPAGAPHGPPPPRAVAEGYRLDPLGSDELRALALASLLPGTDATVNSAVLARVIAAAERSPGALRALLARPEVSASVLDPAAPDPGPLQPVDDALEEQLERLPDNVAEPLAVAALLGAIAPKTWFLDACDLADVNPDGLQSTDWTSVGTDGLMRFATPRAHEAARDFAFRSKPWEALTAAQRTAVRNELSYEIKAGYNSDWAEVPESVRVEALRSITDLRWDEQPPETWREDYLGWAAQRRAMDAEELHELIEEQFEKPPLWLMARTTEALIDAGLHAAALDYWRSQAKQAKEDHGPGSDLAVAMRGNVAALLSHQATELLPRHPAAAREIYAKAVKAHRKVLKAIKAGRKKGSEQHLDALESLMRLHEGFKEWERARKVAATLAKGLHSHPKFGDWNSRTLWARAKIAYCTALAGESKEALALYNALWTDQATALGPNDLETLKTRYQIAYLTGLAGESKEALALYNALCTDQAAALGPNHPQTLRTRLQVTIATAKAAEPEKALALYKALWTDQVAALGPNHPETLATRAQIAYSIGSLGNLEEALALYDALVPDLATVLGSDHRDTLNTRFNIANCTEEVGNLKEALALYEALLSDQATALGPSDPDTLKTRIRIAYCTGRVGRREEALALYRALLNQATDMLTRHADTATASAWTTSRANETSRFDEALALYKALLSDRTPPPGPTLPTR
ncbi:MAG: tetratricopeptide repeat protein [Bifidobacteriaceae bacterium]|nr:tetratricopeptide repeat protein [Bifidobacteriaceae bacterium]